MRDNSRLAQEAVLDANSGRAAILALKNTLASQVIDQQRFLDLFGQN